jgi:excisionase family DNA binding protein
MEKLILLNCSTTELHKLITSPILGRLEALEQTFLKQSIDCLLTREEASEVLKIDLSTLHRWTKQGKISAHAIGSRIYYKESSIQDALIKINSVRI